MSNFSRWYQLNPSLILYMTVCGNQTHISIQYIHCSSRRFIAQIWLRVERSVTNSSYKCGDDGVPKSLGELFLIHILRDLTCVCCIALRLMPYIKYNFHKTWSTHKYKRSIWQKSWMSCICCLCYAEELKVAHHQLLLKSHIHQTDWLWCWTYWSIYNRPLYFSSSHHSFLSFLSPHLLHHSQLLFSMYWIQSMEISVLNEHR